MARLLILLACARVATGVMDALDIKAVCEVPTDGGPRKIYLDMDAAAVETLAGPPGPDNSMSLPIDTTACEPFKSAYINFSPGGHPAWDGKGDGYGINHFDIHFYTITQDARVALMGSCVQPPGAGNCDASAPENAPFYVLPDPSFMTGFVDNDSFGGHAVPGHGLHLLPAEDVADGGPANCKSTGPNGNWVDCQNQQLSLLGVPGFPPAPNDQGCACGTWANGVSPILLSFDGQVVASEIMASQQHVKDLGASEANPFTKPYPQQDKYMTNGFHPTSTWSYKTDDGRVQLGLVLSETPEQASCEDDEDWHKTDDPAKDCAWVAKKPETQCAVKGPGWGQAKLRAAYACKGACGGPCQDLCQDAGTMAWHKKNDETKGCAWVSIFPAMRCLVKSEDGTLAREACPDSCSREHIIVGGPDGSGDKNCCGGGSACGWAWCEAEGKCTQVWDCPIPCTKEYMPVCGDDGKTYDNSCVAEAAGVKYVDGACQPPSAVHVLQKFYTDENCQNENEALTEAMYPQNNPVPDGFTDPSYEEGVCSELVGPLFSGDIVIPFEHSGKLRCGPGNCEATLDWWVGSKTCDGDGRVESMTFTFPPDATDGTMSACVVTNGAGSDGECSAGGQACSRAIQYHEFLPGQTSRHVHEYCACN